VVLYTCNPSTKRLRQEDHKFKASLGYMVKPCLKQKSTTKENPQEHLYSVLCFGLVVLVHSVYKSERLDTLLICLRVS
jgi:hypothetical protein